MNFRGMSFDEVISIADVLYNHLNDPNNLQAVFGAKYIRFFI